MKTATPKRQTINLQLRIGVFLLIITAATALSGVMISRFDLSVDLERRLQAPTAENILGTDMLGRDLFSCILYGTGVSLSTAAAVIVISVIIGGTAGLTAGYIGGITDMVIMRVVDIINAFPGILAAVALAAVFHHRLFTLILVLSATGWVEYTRIIRSEVFKYKHEPFIQAAVTYNASGSWILFRHLLPLVTPLLLVQASMTVAGVILAESGLNFLGIGLSPHIPTLGQLIDSGRAHIFYSPIQVIAPGAMLFVIVTAFNFIGEGLRRNAGLYR